MKTQRRNTVRFVSDGLVRREARLKCGETHEDAARRVGISVGNRQCEDGTVSLGTWNGYRGEVRFA